MPVAAVARGGGRQPRYGEMRISERKRRILIRFMQFPRPNEAARIQRRAQKWVSPAPRKRTVWRWWLAELRPLGLARRWDCEKLPRPAYFLHFPQAEKRAGGLAKRDAGGMERGNVTKNNPRLFLMMVSKAI
jgi:hypothetical protein